MNEIRTRAAQFALDWADSPGDERQDAQSFVRDLLGVYGITKTRAAFYEKRTKRSSTGTQGYIDALIPGLALIEMKSAGKDLVAAEKQALDYIDDLGDAEMPRWVITSDFRRFRLLDLEAADGADVLEFELGAFTDHAEAFGFFAGYGQREFGSRAQEQASIEAAQMMASLYEALEGSGYDDHEASVFLVRLLFALYADDAGVWERDLFLEFLETRTAEDGSDLGPQLSLLFQVMGRETHRRQSNLDELVSRFPYVNGGIFLEPLSIPSFSREMRDRLMDAAMFNWAEISPAIFGSLFQAVKSPEARRQLGEHYTTETNILKLIGPMWLDELRGRFLDHFHDAKALRKLRADLGSMRFLDPACGCGNFLVVGYRELRRLDLEVLQRLQELGAMDVTLAWTEDDRTIKLESFAGIELEEWPARIAATALHLADHQANVEMLRTVGVGPETLPLDRVETIRVGNALRMDWGDVVAPSDSLYVMGNPPFIGHTFRTPEQVDDLKYAWGLDDIGRRDYVTGWFAKAAELLERPGYAGEFAFVSTNSIVQGEAVAPLWGTLFASSWRIKFAHRTFAWASEAPGAAAVHCVIVGMDRARRGASPARLFDYATPKGPPTEVPVSVGINGYLIDGKIQAVEARQRPLSGDLPPAKMGSKPIDGGNLIVEPEDFEATSADPIASQYIRPLVGARELLQGSQRWVLWLADAEPSDIARSNILKSRVEAVRAWRLGAKWAATREAAAIPHLLQVRAQPTVPYLCIPKVSSESRRWLPCAYLEPEVITTDLNFAVSDPQGLAFAAISSSAFITWQKTIGGRLESRLRFSNTIVWNTFPLPKLTDPQRAAIIAGGEAVLEARALHPDRSLADHYNVLAMTPELLAAHRKLDRAVDAVFGLKGDVDELARQKALFKSYAAMIAADELELAKKPRRKRVAKG